MVAFAGDVSRQSAQVRAAYAEGLAAYLDAFTRAHCDGVPDAEARAAAIRRFSELVGALTLARSVARDAPELSDEILRAVRASDQSDRGDEPAVVRLLAVGRAAVAEEPRLVGVGVEAAVLETDDAGARRALADIAVQIEHRARRIDARDEEARRLGIGGRVGLDEFGADLVGGLRDAGAERGADVPRRCAERAIAATVASTMPVSAPFQPACAAPTTRASASANRIMPQSAPVTPSARPGVAVTSPSQRGRASGGQGAEIATTSGEWT